MFLWQAFIPYITVTSITPGPNNIMSMNHAGRFGLKQSMRFVLGMFSGFLILMLVCAAFCAALFHVMPTVTSYLRYVGAAYMLWLAYKTLRFGFHTGDIEAKPPRFSSGMVLQFVNPKVMIYGVTAMSAYILPVYSDLWILGTFAFLLAFTGFCSMLVWSLFGVALKSVFDKHGKAISVLLALALVYCAVALFL